MPLFEHQYGGEGFLADGRTVRFLPVKALRDLGPVLHVEISVTHERAAKLASKGREIPKPAAGLALIDTGCSITAVDESICQSLGVEPTSVVRMSHAGGTEERPCYPIRIQFLGTPLPPYAIPRASSVRLSAGKQPYILLLGRDFLSHMKMVYNGPAGRIELAF
jgi:predicted aspartyl protease